MVASVAKSMASTGVSLASSDSSSSAALIKAAVLIAGDSAVSAADNTVANAVGASAAQAVAILQTIDPGAAATVQTAIAISGSESIQVAYNNGGSQTNSQQTGQTQAVQTQVRQTQTTQTTQTVVVVEPTPEPQQRSATITLSYGTFVVSWFDGATTVTLARTGVGSATGFEVTVNTLNGMTSAARQDLQSKLEALLSPVVITVGTGDIITVSPSS